MNRQKQNAIRRPAVGIHKIFWLLLAIALGQTNQAIGDEIMRPARKWSKVKAEGTYYRVPSAKVAWVDFALVRHDFPELKALSDGQIENLILENFGYISSAQLKLRGLRSSNFEVDLRDARRFAIPESYGRASVAPAIHNGEQLGLVDLKGSGHASDNAVSQQAELFKRAKDNLVKLNDLRIMDHNDGMISLGEAIAETTRQRAVQLGFDIKGVLGETVENYFIIDYGFDILKENGEKIPAGLVGRQAHVRSGSYGMPGHSSVYTDPRGMLQRTVSGASVDFGGVFIELPELKANFSSLPGELTDNPQASKVWAEGHEVARAFRETANQNIFEAKSLIYEHIRKLLNPLEKEWLEKRTAKLGEAEIVKARKLVDYLEKGLRYNAWEYNPYGGNMAIDMLEKMKLTQEPWVDSRIASIITAKPPTASLFTRLIKESGAGPPRVYEAIMEVLANNEYNPMYDDRLKMEIIEHFREGSRFKDSPRTALALIQTLFSKHETLRTSAVETLKHFESLKHPDVIARFVSILRANPARYSAVLRVLDEGNLLSYPEIREALSYVSATPGTSLAFQEDAKKLLEKARLSGPCLGGILSKISN